MIFIFSAGCIVPFFYKKTIEKVDSFPVLLRASCTSVCKHAELVPLAKPRYDANLQEEKWVHQQHHNAKRCSFWKGLHRQHDVTISEPASMQ